MTRYPGTHPEVRYDRANWNFRPTFHVGLWETLLSGLMVRQEALGTAHSGGTVIRRGFLEKVAFKLRTRERVKADQVEQAALAYSVCSLQVNRELGLGLWEVPPGHLDSAPTSIQAECPTF